jgi:2-polyprenyl-6-methoxyphenol hydroxylase-like FAD-dependent oxidoreductase
MEGICHMSDLHVLVVGAGLGGLALAQGLRRAGIAVTVVERDASLTSRRQGYRLHLDAEGRDALRRVLPPASAKLFFATAGVPAPRFTVLDHRLDHVMTQEAGAPTAGIPDDLAVDRLVLRRILLAGVQDRVVFGQELQRFVEHDGGVTAYFTDGSQARCDVLVGADGIGSAVRRQYLPHARIVDTGVWQLYGTVPLDEHTRPFFDERMRGIFTVISGPGAARLGVAPVEFPEPPHEAAARLAPDVALQPVGDYMTCSLAARHDWFGLQADELRSMSGAELHSIMVAAVRTWHPRVHDIVARCDPASLFALPLRSSVPTTPWATTRTTLLGDAVHAMSPAAGAGACMALRDAAHLTDALTGAAGGRDLLAALEEYEADMTTHGFAAVLAGARNGERFLGQDPLPAA